MALTIAKLEQAVAAMQERSSRSDVVAPVAGVVNKLFVTTVGGVAKPGEPLAQIVPADARIIIERPPLPRRPRRGARRPAGGGENLGL